MKRIIGGLLLTLLLGALGCKTTSVVYTSPSGHSVKFADDRMLMTTAAEGSMIVNPTNGIVTIIFKAQSTGDQATIEAIARGVSEGITKATVKP